jgi:hypothetical protein
MAATMKSKQAMKGSLVRLCSLNAQKCALATCGISERAIQFENHNSIHFEGARGTCTVLEYLFSPVPLLK